MQDPFLRRVAPYYAWVDSPDPSTAVAVEEGINAAQLDALRVPAAALPTTATDPGPAPPATNSAGAPPLLSLPLPPPLGASGASAAAKTTAAAALQQPCDSDGADEAPQQRLSAGAGADAGPCSAVVAAAAASGPVVHLSSEEVAQQVELLKEGLLGRGERPPRNGGDAALPRPFDSSLSRVVVAPSRPLRQRDGCCARLGSGPWRRTAVGQSGDGCDRQRRGACMCAGATAVVFQCRWPSRFGPGALLAAKVLQDPYREPEHLESFKYEAQVLEQLR